MSSTCTHCHTSLMGKRYVLREEKPTCLGCFETTYANKCEKCKSAIGTDAKDLTYKGKHYHEDCFLCAGCNNSLANQQFITQGDQLICTPCYEGKYAEKCEICKNAFKHGAQKVEYGGKHYHYDCFVCQKCKVAIGDKSFMPSEGKVTCMNCHNEHYVSKCGDCAKPVKRGGVKFCGVSYHRECFVCTKCKTQLAGVKFATNDSRPYCQECYVEHFSKRCHFCEKPISGLGAQTKYCSFEGRHWHTQCFNCSTCNISLMGEGFLFHDNRIMCSKCGQF